MPSLLFYRGALYREDVPEVRKRHMLDIGGFKVYRVDGAEIRKNLEPDFTNWGQPMRWPELIPPDELWMDEEAVGSELGFFLGRAILEHRLMKEGMSYDKANEVGAAYERRERRKKDAKRGLEKPSVPEDVKLQLLGVVDGIEIWVVDGESVRTYFYVDFTEGGHDLVYDFVPDHEIWLDDDLLPEERVYVLRHEMLERKLMHEKDMSYEDAHLAALRAEQDLRLSKEEPQQRKGD